MELKLRINDIPDLVSEFGRQQYFVDEAGTREIHYEFDYGGGLKGAYRELVLDNLKIQYGNSLLEKEATLLFEYEIESIELHFNLKGQTCIHNEDATQTTSIKENEHNILYSSQIKGKLACNSTTSQIFEVNLSPSFFAQYLPEGKLFDRFREFIEKRQTSWFNSNSYPITTEMHFVIREMMECKWKGHFRKMFMEAKTLELLLLQFDQFRQYESEFSSIVLSDCDIERMNQARSLIMSRLNTPLSLNELAREVGTNECSLKKYFKQVFGTTVFGFIRTARMKSARQMLVEENMTINQVSDLIGYKNPQHFSTAFKKHYGISPSNLKKVKPNYRKKMAMDQPLIKESNLI